MRDIVKPFVESLGASFVSDEVRPDGYRARIEKDGQTAAVVVRNAEIEVIVAKQLDEIHKAWTKEEADHRNKINVIDSKVVETLRLKGFGEGDAESPRLGDYVARFRANGDREVRFTREEIAAHTPEQLVGMVEQRVNHA